MDVPEVSSQNLPRFEQFINCHCNKPIAFEGPAFRFAVQTKRNPEKVHLERTPADEDATPTTLLDLASKEVALERQSKETSAHSSPNSDASLPNDDSAAIFFRDQSSIIAIADGVGGQPLGNDASATTVGCLMEAVAANLDVVDFRPVILDAIEKANRIVLAEHPGAATTLTVLETGSDFARVYQVGDSMAIVFSGQGKIKYRSTCHSPVGYLIESGAIDDASAMHHAERHYISNMVGCVQMSIEVGPILSLSPRDWIVVGSDGLFDNVSPQEIVRFAGSGTPCQRVGRLMKAAAARMRDEMGTMPSKPDDVTVAVWSRYRPRRKKTPAT